MVAQDYPIRFGLLCSFGAHILLSLYIIFGIGFNFGKFEEPVVYSITLEGGKSLGALAQVAQRDEKGAVAPPKKVQSKEEEKKEEPKKEEPKKETPKETKKEEAEVSIPDKKEEKKVEKKPEEKKVQKKDPGASEVNKRLDEAVQRYLGESSDAGGKGFGAAKVGGSGMGGGVIRPPEFFIYKKILEEHIKSGWRWHDTSAALITQVEMAIEPDGRISKVSLAQSSGNSEFDDSVLRAIEKASPVPRPPDSVYEFFRLVRMTFDPRD